MITDSQWFHLENGRKHVWCGRARWSGLKIYRSHVVGRKCCDGCIFRRNEHIRTKRMTPDEYAAYRNKVAPAIRMATFAEARMCYNAVWYRENQRRALVRRRERKVA